jgi:hypothetical protein
LTTFGAWKKSSVCCLDFAGEETYILVSFMILIVIESILSFIIEAIITSFVCFILSPIVWLICLPFILIIALFRRGKYGVMVVDMLASVDFFWGYWGWGRR